MDLIFLKTYYPEIFLSICVLYILIINARFVNNIYNNYPILNVEILSQGIVILIALLCLESNQYLYIYVLKNPLISDSSTQIIKSLLIFISTLAYIFIWRSFVLQNINFFEYFVLYFLGLLGILLLINSNSLIISYLVIELQSLAFYILACFKRTSSFSTEAGLKYFILGSFVSCLFLLGSFFIYSSLGTLCIDDISLLLSFNIKDNDLELSVIIGALLIIISLLFKLSIAPFHFWAPDVYEGAPLASTIIFSIIPKLSLFFFLIKWSSVFIHEFIFIKYFLATIGIFSVFLGAYFSITQKRIKRFIIYSSISQLGFLIVSASSGTIESYAYIFFFIIIYLISSILLWGSFVRLYDYQLNLKKIKKNDYVLQPLFLIDLSSYFKSNYTWSILFLSLFFSFAGIPPLSGFLSKLLIIFGLIYNQDLIIALILIVISIVSTYYYLRIIKIIFFDSLYRKNLRTPFLTSDSYFLSGECEILAICFFLIYYLFFNPTLVLILINTASYGCILT